MTYFVHNLALLEQGVEVSSGVQVWANTHIREGAKIEENVIIGESVYIGPGVTVGKNSKIQNQALIYEPAEIGDSVFIGPGAILTNDRVPRASNLDGIQKKSQDWDKADVVLESGCSIGANSVCVAPVRVGRFAMVAAGSVVIKDVADYALVAGNPAKQIGWVDESGQRLEQADDGTFFSKSGQSYSVSETGLKRLV